MDHRRRTVGHRFYRPPRRVSESSARTISREIRKQSYSTGVNAFHQTRRVGVSGENDNDSSRDHERVFDRNAADSLRRTVFFRSHGFRDIAHARHDTMLTAVYGAVITRELQKYYCCYRRSLFRTSEREKARHPRKRVACETRKRRTSPRRTGKTVKTAIRMWCITAGSVEL